MTLIRESPTPDPSDNPAKAPKWTLALLRRVAPPDRAEEVLGDLEEAHRRRLRRRGRLLGNVLTSLEALDMAVALLRQRRRRATGPEALPGSGRRELPSFSRLDFKLGARMLVKHPGLTLVGGLAISFAIAVGVVAYSLVTDVLYPTLPLDDGDRIVVLFNRNAMSGEVEARALHDFDVWREQLESVENVSAFRTLERNLTTAEGRTEPVVGAEISPSAFRLARVPPLLGRGLVETDEAPDSPPVAVLGYDVWQGRFAGDPGVVGRTVRLGSEQRTVVGVMPEGFAFPVSHHLWIPLRLSVLDSERGQGPALQVFGRLAAGATLADAQAELALLGSRTSADSPRTHVYLRPEVRRYGQPIDPPGWMSAGLFSMNILCFVVLLVLMCANVALLVFARTATRAGEIVIRNALGASRGRIVMQLFAEALVLGSVAAVVGLAAANAGLKSAINLITAEVGGRLPFWFHDSLTPTTVLYAGGLTVLGAVVAGVMPALKATGRGMQTRLKTMADAGAGLRMGRVWTGVIVTQVALTVFFVPIIVDVGRDTARILSPEFGFAAEEYLSVRLEMDRETPAHVAATAEVYAELKQRLADEPGVAAVTFARQLPGAYHRRAFIEVDGEAAPPRLAAGHRSQTGSVDMDFFATVQAPVVAGRGFDSGDLESDPGVVLVNETFVREVLGDRNPIGRRVRYMYPDPPKRPASADHGPGPWYEIVGVVRNVAMTIDPDLPPYGGAGLYHPLEPGSEGPVHMIVHLEGSPASFAPRLRPLAFAVDPAVRLQDLGLLDEAVSGLLVWHRYWFRVAVTLGVIALLLANAGIYSVLSFTVSRRTREIGVRVALGADRRRVVAAVFSRSLAQVGLGVALGMGLFLALLILSAEGAVKPSARLVGIALIPIAVMMGTCLVASIEPMLRALRIEPSEALRADV